jgi:type IV pilus assembly protein PilO
MAMRMPVTQREQLMVIIGFLGLAGAGLFWYYKYGPETTKLAVQSAKLDTLEDEISSIKTALQRGTVAQLNAQAKAYSANLSAMQELIPTKNMVPGLLEQISTAARRTGLDVGNIQPLGVEAGADFEAHKYQLTINGGYHEIAGFLTNVSSLSRIVVPMHIQMGALPVPQTGQIDPRKTSQAIVQLHTFVMVGVDSNKTAPPAR